jgi:hypothetical protein
MADIVNVTQCDHDDKQPKKLRSTDAQCVFAEQLRTEFVYTIRIYIQLSYKLHQDRSCITLCYQHSK